MDERLKYAEKGYWDQRYEGEDSYEWLSSFDAFKDLLLPHLQPQYRIAHIGCGNSEMSKRLFELGFENITNVDYSRVVIEKGREKFPEMQWVCDDIRSLSQLPTSYFDAVIEKATLESLLVGEKSPWSPSEEATRTLDAVFSAIHRVLTPSGVFLSLSFTQPHFRVPHLVRRPLWDCHVETFTHGFEFFFYRMKKDVALDKSELDRFTRLGAGPPSSPSFPPPGTP